MTASFLMSPSLGFRVFHCCFSYNASVNCQSLRLAILIVVVRIGSYLVVPEDPVTRELVTAKSFPLFDSLVIKLFGLFDPYYPT